MLTVKCRCIQESLPPAVSEAPSLLSKRTNSIDGQARRPSPCPSCRIRCHCYADDFVTEMSRPLWELFHQHLSCLFSGSSSLPFLKSPTMEETYLRTPRQNKTPAASANSLCLEGTRELSEGPGWIWRTVHTTKQWPWHLRLHRVFPSLDMPFCFSKCVFGNIPRGYAKRWSFGRSWEHTVLKIS